MTAIRKKSETCEEQLRRMCKDIAEGITAGKEDIHNCAGFIMENVYDIEWITHNDHSYKSARLLVAGGGPNIWVNLMDNTVDGYWGNDRVQWPFCDEIGLDNYLEDLHACK